MIVKFSGEGCARFVECDQAEAERVTVPRPAPVGLIPAIRIRMYMKGKEVGSESTPSLLEYGGRWGKAYVMDDGKTVDKFAAPPAQLAEGGKA